MILVTMNERQQNFVVKYIVAFTNIFSPTLKKNGIPYKNRKRKHNKLSDRPFTTIVLKVTNSFNTETHHM